MTAGQSLRFAYQNEVTEKSYTIYRINSSNEIELNGEMTLADQALLSNWSEIQPVNVFRVGSKIPLMLKQSVNDTGFQYVDFFQDGLRIGRDVSGFTNFHSEKEGNYTISAYAVNSAV